MPRWLLHCAALVTRASVQDAIAANEGPCDILAAAGNPCVAAHSTTRALYGQYAGTLYNVSRPDGTVRSVGVKNRGGFADIAVLAHLGANFVHLGAILTHLGVMLANLGAILTIRRSNLASKSPSRGRQDPQNRAPMQARA